MTSGFIRACARPLAGVAFAVMALGSSALAQIEFNPPLEALNEIESPIPFALRPGTAADCVGRQTVDGADLPVPPETRFRIAVEEGVGGLRYSLTDQSGGAAPIGVLIGADGGLSLDPTTSLGGASPADREAMAAIASLAPELLLHRRTLDQDDSLYRTGEIEVVFGRLFSAIAGASFAPEISGGSFLSGETLFGERRVAVFKGSFEILEASLSMRVVLDTVEVFDVDSSLRVYSDTVVRIPTPPGIEAPEIILRQNVVCTSGLE